MFCTFELNQAGSGRGNKANVTSCEELNSFLLKGSKCVLFYTMVWMYISGLIQNLKCSHSAQRKHSYPLFSEMKIAQISCKQRHTSVGYTSVAMVTRGSCFSVNSCSCHPIYPPLSLHFPSIWHQGQINKVDKQLKYCSSFWSRRTSFFFFFYTQHLHRTTHTSKDLCSQSIILQNKPHIQRRCEVCVIAATQSLRNAIALGKHKKAVIGVSSTNCYSTESHFCLRSRHRWELGGDTSERFCLFTAELAQYCPAWGRDGEDRWYCADLKRISDCLIEYTFLSQVF